MATVEEYARYLTQSQSPQGVQEYLRRLAKERNIPEDVLLGMGEIESGFNPKAVGPETSYGRALGVLQVLPSTAEEMGVDATKLQNLDVGAKTGTSYLQKNLQRSGGDMREALRMYYGGPGYATRGPKVQEQTAKYADDVLAAAKKYQAQPISDPWETIQKGLREQQSLRENVILQPEVVRTPNPIEQQVMGKPVTPEYTPPLEAKTLGDKFRNQMQNIRQVTPGGVGVPVAALAETAVAVGSGLWGFIEQSGEMIQQALRAGIGPDIDALIFMQGTPKGYENWTRPQKEAYEKLQERRSVYSRPPDFWKKLIEESGKTAEQRSFTPGTPEGQLLTDVALAIPHAVTKMTENIGNSLVDLGFPSDQMELLKFATSAYLVGKVIPLPKAAWERYRGTRTKFEGDLRRAMENPTPENFESLRKSSERVKEVVEKDTQIRAETPPVEPIPRTENLGGESRTTYRIQREGKPEEIITVEGQRPPRYEAKEAEFTEVPREAPPTFRERPQENVIDVPVDETTVRIMEPQPTPIQELIPKDTPIEMAKPQALPERNISQFVMEALAERRDISEMLPTEALQKKYAQLLKEVTEGRVPNYEDFFRAIRRIPRKKVSYGPEVQQQIYDAYLRGEDITSKLPQPLQRPFQELLQQRKSTPTTPEEIWADLQEVLKPSPQVRVPRRESPERGGIARNVVDPGQGAAIMRLDAFARANGMTLKELLKQHRGNEIEKAIAIRFAEQYRNPIPQPTAKPYQPQLTRPTPGDVAYPGSKVGGRQRPDVMQSEINAFQQSKDIRPSHSVTSFKSAWWALRDANLLYPVHTAGRTTFRAFAREYRDVQKDLRIMTRHMTDAELRRVTQYAYSLDPQGRAALAFEGIAPPARLTPKEQAYFDMSRKFYEQMHAREVQVREGLGMEPIGYVENYFPFMQKLKLSERIKEFWNPTTGDLTGIDRALWSQSTPDIPFAKSRTGAEYTREWRADKLLDAYARNVLEHIHTAPFVGKLRELMEGTFPDPVTGKSTWTLKEQRPNLYKYLDDLTGYLTTGTNFKLSKPVESTLAYFHQNMAYSFLAGKLRSIVVQPVALKNTMDQVGIRNTFLGMMDAMNPKKVKELYEHSTQLDVRRADTVLNEIVEGTIGNRPREYWENLKEGKPLEPIRDVGRVALGVLNATDHISATVSGLAAKRFGEKALGLRGEKLWDFVDDIVIMTQGGSMPIDTAPIQRSIAGKAATMFQRFTMNDWNYFAREVFGQKYTDELLGKNPKHIPYVMKRVLQVAILGSLTNTFFEDVLGFRAPLPAPIRTAQESIEEGDDLGETAFKIFANATQVHPVANVIRYGTGVGGPIVSSAVESMKSLAGRPMSYKLSKEQDDLPMATLRLMGSPMAKFFLPGSGAIEQYVRGQDRGLSQWESITGSGVHSAEPRRNRGDNYGLGHVR